MFLLIREKTIGLKIKQHPKILPKEVVKPMQGQEHMRFHDITFQTDGIKGNRRECGRTPWRPPIDRESGRSWSPRGRRESGTPWSPRGRRESGRSRSPRDRRESGTPWCPRDRRESGTPWCPRDRRESGTPWSQHNDPESRMPWSLRSHRESGRPRIQHNERESATPWYPRGRRESARSRSPHITRESDASRGNIMIWHTHSDDLTPLHQHHIPHRQTSPQHPLMNPRLYGLLTEAGVINSHGYLGNTVSRNTRLSMKDTILKENNERCNSLEQIGWQLKHMS